MKKGIHPEYREVAFVDLSINQTFIIRSAAQTREFAEQTMADDLARLEYLPGTLYNFHPGSHVGQGEEEGIRLIAELLNSILRPEQQTTVLLETMAGKGTEVGRTFEELREILDRVELNDKMGDRKSTRLNSSPITISYAV